MKIENIKELGLIIARKVKQFINEEYGKIAVLIKLLIPVLIIYLNLGYLSAVLLYCFLIFLSWCIRELDRICNHKTKESVPIPYKKFTEKNNDYITIQQEDTQEAILYLYTVEEYLKSKGYL